MRVLHVGLVLALLAAPATAGASASQVFKSTGDDVTVVFSNTDPTGCVVTTAVVNAGAGTVHISPGPPDSTQGVGVAITEFNVCTGVSLVNAGGATTDLTFTMAKDLSSALVVATVVVDDVNAGTSYPVSVNLTWTATGDAVHDSINSTVVIPGGTVQHTSFNGEFRPGSASGTVSDGTTNFTPVPSTSAELQTSRDIQVTVSVP
jgi:hypothetical protein